MQIIGGHNCNCFDVQKFTSAYWKLLPVLPLKTDVNFPLHCLEMFF